MGVRLEHRDAKLHTEAQWKALHAGGALEEKLVITGDAENTASGTAPRGLATGHLSELMGACRRLYVGWGPMAKVLDALLSGLPRPAEGVRTAAPSTRLLDRSGKNAQHNFGTLVVPNS